MRPFAIRKTYVSEEIDFFTTGEYLLIPRTPGMLFTLTSTPRLIVTALSGVIATVPNSTQAHAGNNVDLGNDNLSVGSWPAGGLLNAIIGSPVPPPFNFYLEPITSLLLGPYDLKDSAKVFIDVAATGDPGSVYKGRYVVDGFLSGLDFYQ